MGSLVKYEFAKLRKSKMAMITFASTIAYAVFIGVIQVADRATLEHYGIFLSGLQGFSDFAQNSYILPFVIAIIISALVVNDYNHGIIRNMVMSGQPRSRIYLSKFMVGSVVSVILFILCALIHTVILTIGYGFGGGISADIYLTTLFNTMLQYIAFTAFILLICDLTRNAGAAFGITLGLTLVFTIIGGFAVSQDFETGELVVNTTMRFIGDMYIGNLPASAADFSLENSVMLRYMVIGAAYLFGSLGMGIYLFERRDLK